MFLSSDTRARVKSDGVPFCVKFSSSLSRHAHALNLFIIAIKYTEKILPSEIVVRDGKRENAPRRGDSCIVTLSLAKIVVSAT
jgi:hypothetical protein